MKTFAIVLTIAFLNAEAYCQKTISGRVTDNHHQPVFGANVYLKKTYDGAATDSIGGFNFSTSENALQLLVVSCIGYKETEHALDLSKSQESIQLTIDEEINKIDGVTITAGAFEASDTKKSVLLRTFDIVTTAGATADITGVMNTLPGTQTVGEEGKLFVRGGDGREAKTFINGLLVGEPYSATPQNIPSRFRYSPFLFKGAFFSTGGYSAEFGQALSSVLQLNTNDLPARTQTDISLMTVGGDISQTIRKKNTSVYAQIQYTDLQPYYQLVPQTADWQRAPHSLNTTLHIKQKWGESGSLQAYTNYDRSSMSILQPVTGIAADSLRHDILSDNLYTNIALKNSIGQKASFSGGFSFSENVSHVDTENLTLANTSRFMHGKMSVDHDISDGLTLKYGGEWILSNYSESMHEGANDSNQSAHVKSNLVSPFTEASVYFSNKLMFRLGARLEYNDLTDSVQIFPRASMAWKFNTFSQVSVAYGAFAQFAEMQFLKWLPQLNQEQAKHYIASYQYIRDDRIFRAEAYFKKYDQLVTIQSADELSPVIANDGYGEAKGFEIFWRDNKTLKSVDYWISYSYLDTERKYGLFPYVVMPYYASKHNLSVVYKQFISALKSQVGATFSVTSGRPYNDPNTGVFNSKLTPVYKDLSVNYSYLVKPNMILHAAVSNVLGFKNIFGYQYNASPNEAGIYEGVAIEPPAKRFLFVGFFITLSKDKNANQLNNL
ncbi:MAG: carboxypeptidase-like regulatory domain-containing protein [Cyclobacteriaceae bacterium]|nr:carboxypeptidase-like regulatory domain-containing protein [Cyclobacteriaceae bacterium]